MVRLFSRIHSMNIVAYMAKVLSDRFGSIGVRSLRHSEMAAIRGFPDTLTRVFDFPELMSAYEGEADYSKLLFMRRLTTASGSIAAIGCRGASCMPVLTA